MKFPNKDEEELLKNSVVNHFMSGYSKILKEGGLKTEDINKKDILPVDKVSLKEVAGEKDTFSFNADFKIKNYKITFHGTINKNKEIKDEVFWGKKHLK
ncbi:MAG: hypothetical protein HOP08_20610 [Cyclobacteriaceae bacterium]|nr:hypothetical protein [Cyclobacteriaceae bacterium]